MAHSNCEPDSRGFRSADKAASTAVAYDWLLVRVFRAWRVVGRTWGLWFTPAVYAVLFLMLRLVDGIGLRLDPLFFPRLRRTRVTRPIVIVGNPRTGTTLLQRFLAANGVGSGQPIWRMLAPSLTVQWLLRPLLPLLEGIGPARCLNTAAHELGLALVDDEDTAILARYIDGFALYGVLLALDREDVRDLVDPERQTPNARDFAWFEELWRRGQVADGRDRVVAKVFSLSGRLPAFLSYFPDARFICTVRDPLASLPSLLSLMTGMLEAGPGFWTLPEAVRTRYLERLYSGGVELLRRFHRDWTEGRIPRDRVMFVRYDRLLADFGGVMGEILAFVGHVPDDQLRATVRATATAQRHYRSPHGYDLARFGLTAERVWRDCDFYYREFLPDLLAERTLQYPLDTELAAS